MCLAALATSTDKQINSSMQPCSSDIFSRNGCKSMTMTMHKARVMVEVFSKTLHFAVEKMKTEILKQQKRSLKKQNRLQEQAFKDMQRTYDEHVNQIIHQMEREQDRMRRDNERVLEAKMRENQALLKMGFQWEAAQIQSEINSLKADMNKEKSSQHSILGCVLNCIGTATTWLMPGFTPKLIGVGISLASNYF
ncbi:guanylate-binding protein 1-like [Sinocyclocheilus grahami]|uniref:guanylate-binding protein 1-like n=1 Tax=Sinocyclocheilus grahami TaxID=75366 RepID=UPI0007AC82ED|nr:PREDICTED: guanylate-binding protein 1-like [Sinocyclocheilus grahami]